MQVVQESIDPLQVAHLWLQVKHCLLIATSFDFSQVWLHVKSSHRTYEGGHVVQRVVVVEHVRQLDEHGTH